MSAPSPFSSSSSPSPSYGSSSGGKRRPIVSQTQPSLPRHDRSSEGEEEEDDGEAEEENRNRGGELGGANRDGISDPASKRPRFEAVAPETDLAVRSTTAAAAAAPPPIAAVAATASRRTNDEIHSTIRLCATASRIIDTPEFQRLKGIKQLGTADFVYMNCNTTRFEHSIGVMELARRMATNVRDRQPRLGVSDRDVLCVSLAGLLHDVGHGPFSHVYEQFQEYLASRLARQGKERGEEGGKDGPVRRLDSGSPLPMQGGRRHQDLYGDTLHPLDHPYRGHESVSLSMIHSILGTLGLEIDASNLDAPLPPVGTSAANPGSETRGAAARGGSHYPLRTASGEPLTSRDLVFVQECIWGQPVPEYEQKLGPGFHGRPEEKEWLYDIVCNKHSGLDVDKIDYYARDERRAFKGAGEIDIPMIEEAVVAWAACTDPANCHKCKRRSQLPKRRIFGDSGASSAPLSRHLMICYPQKHIATCMDFFKKRFELHTKVYSHKTGVGAAYLICDILCAADPYFRLPVAVPPSSPEDRQNLRSANGNPKREYAGLPISRAFVDPSVYLRCRDSVVDQIANTVDPNLAEARRLINRLWSRDIYKCAIFKVLDMETERQLWELSEEDIVDGMLQVRGVHRDEGTGQELKLDHRDVVVHKCIIHHGSKDSNPLLQMRFLEKHQLRKLTLPVDQLPEATAVQESRYDARFPRHFAERSLRIYSRDSRKQHLVRHVFEQWHAEFQGEMDLTPEAGGGGEAATRSGEATRSYMAFCSQESEDDNDEDAYFDDAHREDSQAARSPHPRRRDDGGSGGLGQVTPVRNR